jgi:hypothetical protein
MKKETQRQHWTQEEVNQAIARALEAEPDGPNKEYWTTDLTVEEVKRRYHTTKFKPTPLKIVLVRRCCGEKFTHVLANKRQARGLDDWRCPSLECRLRSMTLPFGKFEGQTLRWVYEQEPSYLAWFCDTVDGCEEVKEAIRALDGIERHLRAFREKRSRVPPTPTQQEVEWLMGKFSASTVDKVCEELFGEG